jgi:hypothetical protein
MYAVTSQWPTKYKQTFSQICLQIWWSQNVRERPNKVEMLIFRQAFHLSTRSSVRLLRTSPILSQKSPKHSADSYSKDVDHSPPSDPTIHVVDSAHHPTDVQRPHEPPANTYSHTGIKSALDSVAGGQKLGGPESVGLKGGENTGEGPEGKEAGNQKKSN